MRNMCIFSLLFFVYSIYSLIFAQHNKLFNAMGEKEKITIYDLAQRLNTTASTVSRALQNNLRISAKMRKAVQELAAELNFIPDPVAHHLRTGKGNVLGIIVPRIDRNYFATLISSFQTTAQKHDYNIIIAASNENQEEELAAVKSLISKKVDGIAISLSANSVGASYEELCNAHHTPLLYFDRIPEECNTDSITNDNFQIGYDAVMQLRKKGCSKIGIFTGPLRMKQYQERFNGYKKALADAGLELNEKFVFENCITMETGTEAALKILTNEERPDGIFSSGDYSAITAIEIFKKKGIRIPEDIAIIGVANETFDNYLSTPLASFDLNQHRTAELAATILIERLNDKEDVSEPKHIIVKHDLILRDSAI